MDAELSSIPKELRSSRGYWADVNGDDNPDLFLPSNRLNNPTVNDPSLLSANDILAFNGSGFSINTTSAISNNERDSHEAAWTDINNDGRLDIYVRSDFDKLNNSAGGGLLYVQDVSSNFVFSQSLGLAPSLVVGDLNSDGFLDFAYDNGGIAYNNGDETFDIQENVIPTLANDIVHLIDFDNDGLLEFPP